MVGIILYLENPKESMKNFFGLVVQQNSENTKSL
jgi:hypothetical protein